jgi:Rrf2 family protein
MVNSKLTVGIHILALLALAGETPLTSEQIAGSVNTNPVVIRRLLGLLRAAGYVESNSGPGGGWRLKIPADAIALSDLRGAVDQERALFPLHNGQPNPRCPVGGNIQAVIGGIYSNVVQAMDRQLGLTTIADVLGTIQTRIKG